MKSSPRVVNKPVALITARFRLADKTYRRSQVEWALWKFATLDLPRGDEPVSTFRARIKHLLQLDRAGVMFSRTRHAPHVEHALSSHDTEGSGFDAIFTAFDTLRRAWRSTSCAPASSNRRSSCSSDTSGHASISRMPRSCALRRCFDRTSSASPAHGRKRGEDRRVFLVIERVEFAADAFAARRADRGALFREPAFCFGIGELHDVLNKMGHLFRHAIVIEIANMATRIAEFLDEAPLVRRGRPSGSV